MNRLQRPPGYQTAHRLRNRRVWYLGLERFISQQESMLSMQRRFWSKVTVAASGCWPWIGCVNPNGYGRFRPAGGRTQGAHRVAYELVIGPIPSGLHVDHLCRNRRCVNPAHLEPVTQAENNRRAAPQAGVA